MNQTAIQATGLSKSFGEGAAATQAVRDATFEARFGEILFIVGPSGSGKTTLLSMISGILRPTSGTVAVKGISLWQMSADDLAEFRLKTIGFVFQDFHLFPKLTTAENVAIPLILRRQNWNASLEKSEKALAIVGLKDRAALPPVKLSGGEQQRVAIARALVGDPELLILDEPTASLDGDTGRMILQFIREHVLNPTRCILIVTHDARIFEFADRVMHMEDGRITDNAKAAA
jgi:putative ABC transport system ATP-binding protein